MADSLSPEKRSWNMSHIRSKNTSVEVKVRKYLFSLGFRYRKNDKRLPGKPDIVLPKYKTVVFIHGCFWHRHPNCKRATTPKTREDYWIPKFQRNVENDKKNISILQSSGWHTIVIWECEVNHQFEQTMEMVVSEIRSQAKMDLDTQ